MASPRTRSGPRKLSEVARKVVAPQGITHTGWPAVRDTCVKKLGIPFDDWQDGAGRLILAKRDDGHLAAMIDGVGMSLPRQVGKTYLIGAMAFALCVNTPGLLVIWSAHHARTHGETFLSMQAFAKRSKVAPYVRQVFVGSGDEEIRFLNGSRILFGARERGFGRGIPGVDVLVFDEAQILSDRALANMLATMNTSRLGLALYIGTPPRPEDNSESFIRMRSDAWAGRLTDGAWLEFGAERGTHPEDRKQWAVANPSYPHRTPAQSILRLKRKLAPDDFLREGLGIWDADGRVSIFDPHWDACLTQDRHLDATPVLALACDFELSHSAIGAATVDADGLVWVKSLRHGPGTHWVVDEATALQTRFGGDLVVGSKGPASALLSTLREAGVRVREASTSDYLDACGQLFDAVQNRRVRHVSQSELDTATRHAKWRDVGGRRGFDLKAGHDISPLEAVSMAAWAAVQIGEPVSDIF